MQIIEQFEKLITGLKDLLNTKGITQKEIYDHLGMRRNTFEYKIKNMAFTLPELKQIILYIQSK